MRVTGSDPAPRSPRPEIPRPVFVPAGSHGGLQLLDFIGGGLVVLVEQAAGDVQLGAGRDQLLLFRGAFGDRVRKAVRSAARWSSGNLVNSLSKAASTYFCCFSFTPPAS